MNQGRTASIDKTNVVIILSESFSQPAWLKTVKFPYDVIPKTTATMQRTVSGKMLAPGFGSGTANTEYELLTGQSLSQLSPQLSIPYEQLVSHYEDYPSAVEYFLSHGHTPIAIHPFSPRMYARTKVFKTFGFDKFITKDDMKFTGRGGGRFIDDQSAFDEVRHQIDTHDKPVLAHLITMQNHMPFGGQYDDPINPTGLPPKFAKLAGQYARGLARSDEALAKMFAELKKSPEPTAVIFYGDHLPPQVYPQSLVEREGTLTAHQTPFLIWSNRAPLKHTELPTTSPIQFMPKLFDALNVPDPAVVRAARRPRQAGPGDGHRHHGQPAGQEGQGLPAHPGGEEGARRLPDDHVRPEHREALQREGHVRRRRPPVSCRALRRSRGTASGSAPAAGSPSASSGCPWAPGSCPAGPR